MNGFSRHTKWLWQAWREREDASLQKGSDKRKREKAAHQRYQEILWWSADYSRYSSTASENILDCFVDSFCLRFVFKVEFWKLRRFAIDMLEEVKQKRKGTWIKHECYWDQKQTVNAWARTDMVGLKKSKGTQEELKRNTEIQDLLDMVGEWSLNEFHVWLWTDNSYFSVQNLG